MQWLRWWNKANVTAGFSGSFSSKEAAEHDSLETDKVEPVSSCCCGPAKSQVDDSCWGWVKQSWEQQYCSALRCSKQMTQSLTHYHTRYCRQRRSNQSMRPFFWKLNIGRDILKCLVAISRWLALWWLSVDELGGKEWVTHQQPMKMHNCGQVAWLVFPRLQGKSWSKTRKDNADHCTACKGIGLLPGNVFSNLGLISTSHLFRNCSQSQKPKNKGKHCQ